MDTPIKLRGEALFKLGKRNLKLKTSFAAIARIEERLNKGILDLFINHWAKNDFRMSQVAMVLFELHQEGCDPGEGIPQDEIGKALMASGIKNFMKHCAKLAEIIAEAITAGNEEEGATNPN